MKYNGDMIWVYGAQGNIIGHIEGNGGNVRAYYHNRQVGWYDENTNYTYTHGSAPRKGDLLEHLIQREWEKENPSW